MTRAPRHLPTALLAGLAALAFACGKKLPPCGNQSLPINFSPMYSAYDGTHQYQLPAWVLGDAGTTPTWTIDDASIATLTDDGMGGVMLTMKKAGTTKIHAQVDVNCGTSALTVSAASAADYMVGVQRYNNGAPVTLDGGHYPDGGAVDAGINPHASCVACHSAAAIGPFHDVAHTPEQTGGFSDGDLAQTFVNGVVPDGGYFDPLLVSYTTWNVFHRWNVTQEETTGLVVYLRSLTPQAQTGTSNYGGGI